MYTHLCAMGKRVPFSVAVLSLLTGPFTEPGVCFSVKQDGHHILWDVMLYSPLSPTPPTVAGTHTIPSFLHGY